MTRPARPFESNGLTLLTNRPLSAPATRFAGGLLLLLDLLLLTAMWPIVGVFVLATVVCGLVAGAALRRWNDAHPIPRGDRSSSSGNLPDINIGRVPVGGDFGGFLFMCAAIAPVVIGLPSVRWCVIASLGCATLAALSLAAPRVARRVTPRQARPSHLEPSHLEPSNSNLRTSNHRTVEPRFGVLFARRGGLR